MRRLIVIVMTLVLVGCGVSGASESDDGTTVPPATAPDQPVDSDADPQIVEPGPVGSIPEPRPPLDDNVDGEVWITSAELRIMESFPIQIALDVDGEKPTPCHEVFWTVDDDGEVVSIAMISQVPSDQQCAQVVEPFTIAVPLGSWSGESRQVTLNGVVVGSFDS